jgi:hypothetical protein
VVKAMRTRPPSYDPLKDGPVYMQAYVQVFLESTAGERSHAKRPSSKRPATKQAAAAQDSSRPPPAKRARPAVADVCSMHPHGHHTNAECKSQSGSSAASHK